MLLRKICFINNNEAGAEWMHVSVLDDLQNKIAFFHHMNLLMPVAKASVLPINFDL